MGQQHTEPLQTALIKAGLEDVAVVQGNNSLNITYSNNLYRSETRALAEVIYMVSDYTDLNSSVNILITRKNIGILAISLKSAILKSFLNNSLSLEELISASIFSMDVDLITLFFADVPKQNKSNLKFDVPVGLGVRYLLGAFDYPVRIAVDFLPSVAVDLSKGLYANAQFAVPIYNDLDRNNFVRPSLLTLTQDIALKQNVYTSVTAGCFSRNRAGVHATVKKYFLEECFAVGIDLGYTSYTSFTGKVDFLSREDQNYSDYAVAVDYRLRKYDLNIEASYGRFLYQDEGFMVDVTRTFGETSIGFFALTTTSGSNAGFKFSIAIPPGKYTKHKIVRIRPDSDFTLSYRVVGGDRLGRTYLTGNNLINKLADYYPSFITKDLKNYLIPYNANKLIETN